MLNNGISEYQSATSLQHSIQSISIPKVRKVIYNNIEEVDAENNSVIISIDNIPSGNYILHIKGNSVNKQMKLIKQFTITKIIDIKNPQSVSDGGRITTYNEQK